MHYFQNKANFSEMIEDTSKEETTSAIVLPTILPKGIEYIDIRLLLEYRNKNEENRFQFRDIVEQFIDELSKIEDEQFAKEQARNFTVKLLENRSNFAKIAKEAVCVLSYALISVGLPTTLTAISTLGVKKEDPFDFYNIGASCMVGAVASIADVGKSIRKKWNSNKSNYLLGLNKVTSSSAGLHFKFDRYNRLFEEFLNDSFK